MSSRWLTLKRKFLSLSNEGIGAAICAGAYLGGKTPAMIIATSGLLVAAWPLASLHNLFGIPLVLLIPYRGDVGDAQHVMRTYKFATGPVMRLRSRSPFTQK